MTPARGVVIVLPILNDWESLSILHHRLRDILGKAGIDFTIVAVDDASTIPGDAPFAHVVRLVRNVGHQRAIAAGLDYALRATPSPRVVIMDADGEDRPADLPALLAALDAAPGRIVVARRRSRSEGPRFRAFYALYKLAFRLLTGQAVDFGNFCAMDRAAARRLVAMRELWLNLPASVMRSRLPLVRVPTDRGQRYAGRSRMNLVSLVTHGLSAIGVFSDVAFTRVLLAVGGTAALMAASFALGLALKSVGLATPGWVTTLAAGTLIIVVQTATVALCGLFVVFTQASDIANAPAQTAHLLIERVDQPATHSGMDAATAIRTA